MEEMSVPPPSSPGIKTNVLFKQSLMQTSEIVQIKTKHTNIIIH